MVIRRLRKFHCEVCGRVTRHDDNGNCLGRGHAKIVKRREGEREGKSKKITVYYCGTCQENTRHDTGGRCLARCHRKKARTLARKAGSRPDRRSGRRSHGFTRF